MRLEGLGIGGGMLATRKSSRGNECYSSFSMNHIVSSGSVDCRRIPQSSQLECLWESS
jgi:hypothetical protein